jgi:polyhydroxyalkanoate synthesis regulator phasin
MKNRKRQLVATVVALIAAALAAGFVLAQNAEETEATAPLGPDTLLGKVAAILDIEESALTDAFEQARLEAIDDAVADGRLTEEQASAMKAGMEARTALRDVIDDAIDSGKLTQGQADLLRDRVSEGRPIAQRLLRLRGQVQKLRERAQGSGGFGFMVRTPRGRMMGGVWGRCR